MSETPQEIKLREPWLIAVWPGMGSVALAAGYYLMAKLEMSLMAEISASDLFDVEHIEVKKGLIRTGRRPRNRFFVWRSPNNLHDIVLFIGEAQPPLGKYAFCQKVVEFAQQLGVQRVFTFAAMATEMPPHQASRVFAAATDEAGLADLRRADLTLLESGPIGGLNGVLLGAAADSGMQGICLLGEMPQLFAQFPFPKASLAVLQVFTKMAGVQMDFGELSEQSEAMDQHLGDLYAQLEAQMGRRAETEDESFIPEVAEEPGLPPDQLRRIDQLFSQAREDRSKAYELKNELDRLGVFKDYEDRFLDLFRKQD